MAPSRKPPDPRTRERQRVAIEAARLMAADGSLDVRQAKLKAAGRLGVHDQAAMPRNAEVEEELRAYQRLFRGDAQARALRQRREAAAEAMGFLHRFEPRLVGPVLDGTADVASPVLLQLFAEASEDVGRFLVDAGIPAAVQSRRLRLDRERFGEFPAWVFLADGLPFELLVLPPALLRQAPLGADGQPMARASLATLRALLATSA